MTFKIRFLTIRDTFKVLDYPKQPLLGGLMAKLVSPTVEVGDRGSYCVYMSLLSKYVGNTVILL